jgi:tRNA dimethylallyltransferase
VSAPAPVVVALFGPTAVGKTDVAVALAERLRASGERPVAVSADALQLYAGLELLTGAATPAQRAQLEHRLLGVFAVTETASAGRYAALAHAEIDGLLADGRKPIVVGGTGLYLRAALADLELRPPPVPEVRERRLDQLERRGAAALHDELRELAPEAAGRISTGDGHRIVRALELLDAGSRPPGGGQLWTRQTRHPTLLVGVTMDRELLRERIDRRVDAMVRAGVEAEVRRADAAGASPTARKALGFEELLRGDVAGLKRRTWAYARRQLTWMRKLPDVVLLDVSDTDPEAAAESIAGMMRP